MSPSDMIDFEWEFVKCVLPDNTRRVPRVDDRRTINGILHVLKVGCPRRHLPRECGPRTTASGRFDRWTKAGVRDRIMDVVADRHNVNMVMVDGTSIRVHHSGATLAKDDPRRCTGRSGGGLTVKAHASANRDGLPLDFLPTPDRPTTLRRARARSPISNRADGSDGRGL